MTSILKLKSLSNTVISESLFLGGTTLSEQTDTSFTTSLGDYTLHFIGRHLTYDAQGMITGGKIDEYRLYQGALEIADQIVIVDANPNLMSGQFLAEVFALHDAGDVALANARVMQVWTRNYFSITDYSLDDVRGTRTDDFLDSPQGGNRLWGLAGSDLLLLGLNGGQGYGGAGDDFIYSNNGFDQMYGGPGDDRFFNRGHRDTSMDEAYGGQGNDLMGGRGTLEGGIGNDTLGGAALSNGGDGDDVITAGGRGGIMNGGAGADTVTGDIGIDHVNGGAGNDRVRGALDDDLIAGGAGDDLLAGGIGNDQITGGTGADTVYGSAGDDTVSGEGGGDRLFAGVGRNEFTGGAGRDHFIFGPGVSTDIIHDFEIGQDHLSLRRFDFADLAAVSAVLSDTGSGDALFTFAAGQTLLVLGVSAADLLADVTI